MSKPLNYVPPRICCHTGDDEGPHFGRRWKSALKLEADGCFDLFQPDSSQPCSRVHQSCLCEFLLGHGTKTPAGKVEIDKVCIICEVKVHSENLMPLCKQNDARPIVWGTLGLHGELLQMIPPRRRSPSAQSKEARKHLAGLLGIASAR